MTGTATNATIPEHTPGPWHSDEPLLIGRFLIRDDAGEIVAEVCGLPWSETETEGNARLIAAAPELLTALKQLLGFCETAWCIDEDEEGPDPNLLIAREAIAKAEGRDS